MKHYMFLQRVVLILIIAAVVLVFVVLTILDSIFNGAVYP